eukprot:6212764-Prymnesium_polylepis.1
MQVQATHDARGVLFALRAAWLTGWLATRAATLVRRQSQRTPRRASGPQAFRSPQPITTRAAPKWRALLFLQKKKKKKNTVPMVRTSEPTAQHPWPLYVLFHAEVAYSQMGALRYSTIKILCHAI